MSGNTARICCTLILEQEDKEHGEIEFPPGCVREGANIEQVRLLLLFLP